jgi:hypothetical protein
LLTEASARKVLPEALEDRQSRRGIMATSTPVSLQHHFADLIDPRSERSRRHELLDIVGLAICAVISGAESWTAVEA